MRDNGAARVLFRGNWISARGILPHEVAVIFPPLCGPVQNADEKRQVRASGGGANDNAIIRSNEIAVRVDLAARARVGE